MRLPKPVAASPPASLTTPRSFDMSVILLSALLLGFFLARLAAPLFASLPPCKFHEVFGIPCPSCGVTRAGLALANGKLLAALAFNPLFVIGIGILFGWSACRVLEKWRGEAFGFWKKAAAKFGSLEFNARQRWLRWAMIGAIFLNWLYLIWAASFSA